MLEKMSATQLTATTESDQFSFHIRLLTPFRSGEVRRTLAAINSKTFEQLHCDPTHFCQFAEAVFFFENAKFVHLHFTKQVAINRPHDLGGDHGASIFTWKGSLCTREKLSCTSCFKLHQLDKALIILSILQLGFGVTETRHIFQRQIDAVVPQIFPDITNNVRHLQRQAELKRILF